MRKNLHVLAVGLAALLLGLPGCVAKSKFDESQKQNEQLKKEAETLKGQV